MSNEKMQQDFDAICARAQQAKSTLATCSNQMRNKALTNAANLIRTNSQAIETANATDMQNAKSDGLSEAMLDRLMLNQARINAIADALDNIATIADPVGRVIEKWDNPKNGLKFERVTIPIGIIGIIYESRPNVTADAAALCLKSGNVVILRGGKESIHSSKIISDYLRQGIQQAGSPTDAVQFINEPNRYMVELLLKAAGKIDLIIPRGGKGLTGRVMQDARVPVLAHLDGNCHIYVDDNLKDCNIAEAIIINAKMRRTGICGALETLLMHGNIAPKLLPSLLQKLNDAKCVIRGDDKVQQYSDKVEPATEEDWREEYLQSILAIKIVGNVDEAIQHINHYGSHHTDAIISDDADATQKFMQHVDSAIVMHNCSTQYADGGEFGMGAEIGIATGRLHARGPVAARELVTYKNLVYGDGHCRP
ncbi:MAG: glutamate-5-semialdehyde dehydrogenase [Alphaproteobacteria bacterium]|nr:glutamate-5-semialdehyde dehydrogenase [Alphaproteobacteria bacterium]